MDTRADIAMAERGLCKSRSRARMLLLEGRVLLNGSPCTKPSMPVHPEDVLEIAGEDIPYVGRGGLKLEEALRQFDVAVEGRICMDIGASTGGFTDCMLQKGAGLVYAIDVGHGQLDPALVRHPQVINLEGTDVRQLRSEQFSEQPDFCSIDVSFISLGLILPSAYGLLAERADCIALIKPQFEAGKANIGKRGIVKSAKVHMQVLTEVTGFARQVGFHVQGLCPSPIRGGSGNTEYLAHLSKGSKLPERTFDLQALVRYAGLNG